jgi:hypothetical protein
MAQAVGQRPQRQALKSRRMTALLAPSVRPYGVACATSPRTQGRGLLAVPVREFSASGRPLFWVSGHGRSMGLHQSPVYGIGSAISTAQTRSFIQH